MEASKSFKPVPLDTKIRRDPRLQRSGYRQSWLRDGNGSVQLQWTVASSKDSKPARKWPKRLLIISISVFGLVWITGRDEVITRYRSQEVEIRRGRNAPEHPKSLQGQGI